MNIDTLIARSKDPAFQKDVRELTALGVKDPQISAFLLPLLGDAPAIMNTYSGKRVNLLNPEPETLLDIDVAHHLAGEPRYASSLTSSYSVGAHCLWVADRVQDLQRHLKAAPSPVEVLTGLWHDAPEAYLKDLHLPLKRLLRPLYDVLEARMWQAMCVTRPLLPSCKTPLVDRADKEAAAKEALALLATPPSWALSFKFEAPECFPLHYATTYSVEGRWLARSNELRARIGW